MNKTPKVSRQRKQQVTYETTPKMITEEILGFCQGVAPDQIPVFVPVRPVTGCEAGRCFPNVARHVQAQGGKSVFGWTIWQSPALLHAEFHCNWQGPDGKMVDITPKPDGERRILFLPEPTRRWENRTVPSHRKARLDHPLIHELIQTIKTKDELWAAYIYGSNIKPGDMTRLCQLELDQAMILLQVDGLMAEQNKKTLQTQAKRNLRSARKRKRKLKKNGRR